MKFNLSVCADKTQAVFTDLHYAAKTKSDQFSQMLMTTLVSVSLLTFAVANNPVQAAEGVADNTIRIAGVMDLEGRSRGLGTGMKKGIEAAIRDQKVQGRNIEFLTLNDSYTPDKTIASTNELIGQDVLLFAGNVGTPTAKVSLPILAKNKIPALGFFTGAGLLRPGEGQIINYRASYVQETAKVIESALEHGIKAPEICAYVQNDAYGMAGVEGIRRALQNQPNNEASLAAIEKIIAMEGENPKRNGIGPIGVYQRNSYLARPGYESLKAWETAQDVHCKLVVTVGAYTSIAKFIGYAHYKQENWVYSAVSFTGADNFKKALRDMNVADRVIMTQVVPLLDSELPIVQDAKAALGDDFGYVSLEGYIVGQLLLKGLNGIEGDINRASFVDALMGNSFEIGGLMLDFSEDNQGSDLVMMTVLQEGDWQTLKDAVWTRWL